MLKISITIEKRIILHLANYYNFKDSFEVDTPVTQSGIAVAIYSRIEHVSRANKNLIAEEYIYARSAHVKGIGRRKRAYFLTMKGMAYAKEIKKMFNDKSILIRTLKGELREIKFHQLKDFLDFPLQPLDVFKYISTSKKDILDLNQVLSDQRDSDFIHSITTGHFPTAHSLKKDFIFSPNVPSHEPFFGRNKELGLIRNVFRSDSKIIVVHGIAGIGKTTLISKSVSELKTKTNVFWYHFEAWSSIKHLLKSLSEFLNQIGREKLASYFDSHRGFHLGEVIDILSTELDGINAIIIFDDFHKCDKHTLDLFSSLKRLCEKIEAPKIIVITRLKLRFYDRRDVAITKSVFEIHLTGLDLESSRRLLNIEDINDKQFKELYKIINGHPVALRLLDSIESVKHQSDFRTFINEQVFDELSNDEKKLLNIACIFRYPIEADALFVKEDHINFETLSRLEQKFLLMTTSGNAYFMHDLLVDIYYKRLTPEQKKFYHKYAAEYYTNKNSDVEVMERIYHLINAKEFKHSGKLVIEFGERLISSGYLDFFNILNFFNNKNLPLKLYKEILTLKGDALTKMGDWDRALSYYEKGLRLLEQAHDQENAAEVYIKIGNIYGQMGNWKKTIELHHESLRIFKSKGKKREMAKIYNDLGMIYRQMGDFKKSLVLYKKSIKIFEEINEKIGISVISLNMGKMYESMGNKTSALKNFERGLKFSEESNYKPGIAFSNKLLGMYYHSNDEIDKSVSYFQEGLNNFDKLKNDDNIIQICDWLGDIYQSKNKYGIAIEIYKKGINNLEEKISKNKYLQNIASYHVSDLDTPTPEGFLENNIRNDSFQISTYKTLANLYEKIGNIHRAQESFHEALINHTKYLNAATEIADDQEIAMAMVNIGIDHRKLQAYDKAMKYYNDALKKLNANNDLVGILTVYRNIGKIYELKGKHEKALSNYKRSLNLAKDLQYDVGIAKAYNELGEIYLKIGDKSKANTYNKKGTRMVEKLGNIKNRKQNRNQ